jgi:TonB family protein
MLEQLIESKNNAQENKTRGSFLLTTFVLMCMLCFSAVLWSLFAMNPGIGDSELELSSLVAPIAPAETNPPPPEPVQKQKNQSQEIVNQTLRQTNTLRIDETPLVPNEISVTPNTQKSRPKGKFIIDINQAEGNATQSNFSRNPNEGGTGIGENNSSKVSENNEKEEAPDIKKEVVKEKKTATVVSKGVITSQATYLPKPVYPAAARAVKAGGGVSVQVMIDESGKVTSAKAVNGHPLLRAEAEKAARNARFTPTFLSNEPVKVTGVIIYNFVP